MSKKQEDRAFQIDLAHTASIINIMTLVQWGIFTLLIGAFAGGLFPELQFAIPSLLVGVAIFLVFEMLLRNQEQYVDLKKRWAPAVHNSVMKKLNAYFIWTTRAWIVFGTFSVFLLSSNLLHLAIPFGTVFCISLLASYHYKPITR